MKAAHILLIIVFTPIVLFGRATIVPPKVDERVELLSIVFRLAGNEEYNQENNLKYTQSIHKHFDRFKNHPLIRYAQEVRDSSGVAYDAVMSMAISVQQPPSLAPIVPFSRTLPDTRWDVASATKFVKLLQQFYKDADCKAFFLSNAGNYKLAEQRFNILFKKLDVDWYYKYYGKSPDEDFHVVVGLGNGGGNYGPQITMPDKTKKVYAIVGSWSFDSTGNPLFENQDYLPDLIHEFNHSFVNYLTDNNERSLQHAGETIYEEVQEKMRKQQYGSWGTMMSEALVRASVIRYLMTHDPNPRSARKELNEQLASGFTWMRELVNLLGRYEHERAKYPTLESLMPEIIHFYDSLAPKIKTMNFNVHDAQHIAHVISVQPFKDNDMAVSPGIKEIVFNFDKQLDGVRYFFGPGKSGGEHYPEPISFRFANDDKTIIMETKLKPNTEYEVNMAGNMMRTEDGYSVQKYLLHFKTGDK